MIRRIVLERFGRFRGASFALGEVTLFLGPNESGKTTILDALLEALCRPSRASRAGRALEERYGRELAVSVEAEGETPSFDADEFLSLMAVSSGDVHLELPEKARWLDALKADLFSGGVDPASIAATLRREASEGRNTAQGKRLAGAREELEGAREKLAELGERRGTILSREAGLASEAAKLEGLERRQRDSSAELNRLRASLRQQELHARRRRCREAMGVLEEAARTGAPEGGAAGVMGDETPALEALERALASARETSRSAAQEALHASGELRHAEETVSGLRDRGGSRAVRRGRGGERRSLRLLFAVLAALCILLAAASLALLEAPLSLAGSLVGVLLGAGAALLYRAASRREAAAEELARAESELERISAEHRAREAARTQAEEAEQRAAARLESWLRDRGCRDSREYAVARERAVHAAERRRKLEARLVDLAREFGVGSASELRAECATRAAALDAEITEAELDAPSRQRLENRVAELERALERARGERAELERRVAEERGSIKGSLGNLPELMRKAEEEVERREQEVKQVATAMEGAAVAAELLQELAADASASLVDLAAEIEAVYGDITGDAGDTAPGKREVRLERLSLVGATARDGGGELRRLGSLSQGTRDAFALAARLCLAARTGRDSAVVVLDEPFLSLDRERAVRSCRVLERFRRRARWQVVILTKDPELVDAAREAFGGGLLLHELGAR